MEISTLFDESNLSCTSVSYLLTLAVNLVVHRQYNNKIIMYIYHALINALSAHMIRINLNTVFYTHIEHSPSKTIFVRYYMETPTHTHADTLIVAETEYWC